MMKWGVLLILMAVASLGLSQWQKNKVDPKHRIVWSEERPLKWADFKARPPRGYRRVAAITSSVIQYRYKCEGEKLIWNISAIFNKDESWVRSEAKTDEYLQHEQLHFDITELYSRIMRYELSQYRFKCREFYKLERIAESILEDWRDFQQKYDNESDYSLHKKHQAEWQKLVRDLLEDYEEWE